jgi:stage V sporulation protein B
MREQSTTKGFAILSAAGILVKILSLLYVPFLLRIIGDEGYGVYAAAYQIFVFIYVLANSGVPVAISKLVSELIALNNIKDAVKAFKIARFMLLVIGVVMSLLLILLAYPLAKVTDNLKAYLALLTLAPSILITSVMSSYRGFFQGRGIMTPTAVSQIIEQVINTTFSLVFAALLVKKSLEAGVAGGTVGTVLGAFAACIYLIIVYERNKTIRVPQGVVFEEERRLSNKQIFRKLVAYGIPMTLCVGLQNAGTVIDLANIKNRLMVAGFEEAVRSIKYGTLMQYNTLIFVPITLIAALSAAALPAISGASVLNDRKLLQEKINHALRLCFLVSIPSAIGLAVLSKPIFTLLFRNPDGHALLLYGSIVVVLMSIVQIQTTILQGMGKLYIATFALVMGIIAKIALNYVLVAMPQINITGAVIGNVVCYTIPLLINTRIIKKLLKIRLGMFRGALKPFFAAAFMGVVVFLVHYNIETIFLDSSSIIRNTVPLIFSVAAGVFVYSSGLILNGGITKKDLETMPPRAMKLIPQFMRSRIR